MRFNIGETVKHVNGTPIGVVISVTSNHPVYDDLVHVHDGERLRAFRPSLIALA